MEQALSQPVATVWEAASREKIEAPAAQGEVREEEIPGPGPQAHGALPDQLAAQNISKE